MTNLPVILHIPHASMLIPEEYYPDYSVSSEALALENLRLVDMYTDEIYYLEGAVPVVFPVSRFLVDAERFSDDSQESMAQRGMGALYKVGTNLDIIRLDLSNARRKELMDRYYWPHHNKLDETVTEILKESSYCLFIDCHSYPSKALPYELGNMSLPRPQIGIGTDSFHTPPALGAMLEKAFIKRGYEVGLDTPFSGTLVPNGSYQKNKQLVSFMIEVRKDLYMDETTGQKLASFEKVRHDLTGIMREAADFCASLEK